MSKSELFFFTFQNSIEWTIIEIYFNCQLPLLSVDLDIEPKKADTM